MARQKNIFIDQGTDVNFLIAVQNEEGESIDLTGYSARAKLRKHWASSNSASFTCSISDDQVSMSMTNEETDLLTPGRYVYDCEIVSSGNAVTRVVEGICTISPSATY
jgi:hypothetical protein